MTSMVPETHFHPSPDRDHLNGPENRPPGSSSPGVTAFWATAALLGAAFLGSGALLAQQPEPGQLLYDTDVRIDVEAGSLEVRATVSYRADEGTAERVSFLLNHRVRLDEVTGPGVRSHTVESFEMIPWMVVVEVELDGSVLPGSEVIVELRYAGSPEMPPGGINRITEEWVELGLDSGWHPVFATLDQEMLGVVRIELPAGWDAVGAGRSEKREDLHVIHTTTSQVDVAFAAAPALDELSSENLSIHFPKAVADAARAVLEAGENCSGYLNRRYGEEDPLPLSHLVLANRQGPSYARNRYFVLSEVDPDDAVELHRFLCHELAHHWTGTAGPFTPHHWMSEAFAEFVAARYLREHFGRQVYEGIVEEWEEEGRDHGPIWTPEAVERPHPQVMYRRGPWALHRLEHRIGRRQMDRLVERYMIQDIRTTERLLDALEAVAGAEAEAWFREELARPPQRIEGKPSGIGRMGDGGPCSAQVNPDPTRRLRSPSPAPPNLPR